MTLDRAVCALLAYCLLLAIMPAAVEGQSCVTPCTADCGTTKATCLLDAENSYDQCLQNHGLACAAGEEAATNMKTALVSALAQAATSPAVRCAWIVGSALEMPRRSACTATVCIR